MPILNRRELVATSLLAPVALPAHAAAAAATRLRSMPAMDVAARLRGCLDGEFWLWIQGDVFGREPGETLRPLCGFCSVLRMRYTRDGSAAFTVEQRESAHFYDTVSGSVLGEFRNPYTGRTNVAVGYVSPVFTLRLDRNGTAAADGFLNATGSVPHGTQSDGLDVWLSEIRANEYPTGLRRKEFPEAFSGEIRRSKDIVTYRARIADIVDTSVRVVPTAVSFAADLPWLQWMLMGSRPGHVFWYGQGAKCVGEAGLPAAVRRRVEEIHPGFLANPWHLDGTPHGTLEQMRKLRKAGRI